jgi:prepilin-type N-terminal cleavage/methylation domain-containing protein
LISQKGFSLIELAIVMAIMAMMAAASVPSIVESINQSRAGLVIQETQSLLDAARAYRQKVGSWPGGATCLNAVNALTTTNPPYLAGVTTTNKFNQTVSTSCTAQTFSVDQRILADWDSMVANGLPATAVVNPSLALVRSTIGTPGSEPALDNKLSRIAETNAELNRMQTDLLMGGRDIREVRNIDSSGTVSGASLRALQSLVTQGTFSAAGTSQFGGPATFGSTTQTNGTARFSGAIVADGASNFNGAASFAQALQLNRIVTANTACSPAGAFARVSSGGLASCKGGIWTEPGGGSGITDICTLRQYSGSRDCYYCPPSPHPGRWKMMLSLRTEYGEIEKTLASSKSSLREDYESASTVTMCVRVTD